MKRPIEYIDSTHPYVLDQMVYVKNQPTITHTLEYIQETYVDPLDGLIVRQGVDCVKFGKGGCYFHLANWIII